MNNENITNTENSGDNNKNMEGNAQQNMEIDNMQQNAAVDEMQQNNAAGGAQQSDTVYRYNRQYYETHRDENTAFHYNEAGNYANTGNASYTNAGANAGNASYANAGANAGNASYANAGNASYANANTASGGTQDKKMARKLKKAQRKEQRRAGHKKGGFSAVKFARGVAGLVLVSAVAVGSTYASLKIFKDDSEQVVIQTTNTAGTGKDSAAKVTTVSANSSVITADVSSMVKEVMPSVVTISNMGTTTVDSFFGNYQQEYESNGSGIIVGQSDSELLIVTNQHVIAGADTLSVTFIDDETYTADVKGSDSQRDIAVIAIALDSIKEDTLNQIKVATLGDSGSLAVGEPAIAIGNAMGYGQSVTTGVISALNREVSVDNVTNTLIQTDAAINPGNSGGALLNIKGEVIGINSVKYASTEVEGMGYAIPISDVTDIINEMMNGVTKKKVEDGKSGYLGISCVEVNSAVSKTYNMPEGVYVAQVEEGGAADKAGLKKGDIITKIDNTTVSTSSDLTTELQYHEAGTKVTLVVQSQIKGGYGYEEKNIEVTLDQQPSEKEK